MDRFTLELELGNDAMSEPEDIAEALRRVADELQARVADGYRERWIRDANGNRVGSWQIA